jgi:hypothetical protein
VRTVSSGIDCLSFVFTLFGFQGSSPTVSSGFVNRLSRRQVISYHLRLTMSSTFFTIFPRNGHFGEGACPSLNWSYIIPHPPKSIQRRFPIHLKKMCVFWGEYFLVSAKIVRNPGVSALAAGNAGRARRPMGACATRAVANGDARNAGSGRWGRPQRGQWPMGAPATRAAGGGSDGLRARAMGRDARKTAARGIGRRQSERDGDQGGGDKARRGSGRGVGPDQPDGVVLQVVQQPLGHAHGVVRVLAGAQQRQHLVGDGVARGLLQAG